MSEFLRGRNQWRFFGSLVNADRRLAVAWWVVLLLRGILLLFAIVAGILVGAVQLGEDPVPPLVLLAAVFLALEVLSPIHRAIGRGRWISPDRLFQATARLRACRSARRSRAVRRPQHDHLVARS